MSISLKKAISQQLPDSKEELNWIIDKTGSVLFINDWDNHRNVLIKGNCKESKIGLGIITTLLSVNDYSEKNELFNYLFNEAIKKKKMEND